MTIDRADLALEGLANCRLDAIQVKLRIAAHIRSGDPCKLELSWAFQSGKKSDLESIVSQDLTPRIAVSPFPIRYRLDPVSLEESDDADDSRAVETALRNTIIEGRPWGVWTPSQGDPSVDLPCCFLARGVYYFRATIFAQDAPHGWQKRSWQSNVLEVRVA